MIRLRGLRVVYGRTVALDSIDADLPSGLIGLFGPNGSGKSTLLRVLSGLMRPTAGEVTVDGLPTVARSEDIRRRIGYAGHSSGLYAQLSVQENLSLFARLYGMRERRVEEVIERLELGGWRSTPVRALSAGLARRAAVARALLHEPQVLLLDEPYANLDDDAAGLISDAITDWFVDGRLGLIATHGAKKVKRYADAGLILKHGRVALFGHYRRPRMAETS